MRAMAQREREPERDPIPLFQRQYAAPGAAPGTFMLVDGFPPRVHVFSYDLEHLVESDPDAANAVESWAGPHATDWIDVQGLGDGSIVRRLGERYGMHPLAMSDVVNFGQRPKADEYDDEALLVVLRMVRVTEEGRLDWEQVSLFLRAQSVVSFQERPGDCFEPLRVRLRGGRKQIRQSGADYLACMLVDAIVDGYFPVLEHFGEQLERLEAEILERPTSRALGDVYRIKRDLSAFRRAAWPLREALSQLIRDDESPLSDTARLYLRDTHDHVMQVVDVNETYRELASSLVDVYLSMLGHRTNEIMRVLTLVATIFIPLTFVAGIYGMNFDTAHPLNLPELGWRYGYLWFWGVSLVAAAGLLWMFRRLGWLGAREREREREERG